MIAPRHPTRGDAIARIIADAGLSAARRSLGETPGPTTDVYLLDTLGEMGLFYELSSIAFIGGSLVDVGGHNPLEAAHFDTAILVGPDRRNNGAAVAALLQAGGARPIEDDASLGVALVRLIDHPEERRALAEHAGRVLAQHHGVIDRVLDRLRPCLHRETPGRHEDRLARA